ncbi:oligosaccharide flippase family protein [Luteimonas sp. A482]
MSSHRLLRWRPGGLARAGSELLTWFVLRAAAQAIALLLLARLLGATDYGSFVAVLAIAGISASIAGLGLPSVLLRDVAQNRAELPTLLGRALRVWWRSTLIFATATSIVAMLALPQVAAPKAAVFALILAEIATTSLIELLGRSFQAIQRIRAYGLMQAGLPISRLAVLLGLAAFGNGSLTIWLWAYVAVSLAYACTSAWLTRASIGWTSSTEPLWPLVKEGIPFTTGGVSVRIQAEYNKPLLAQAAFAQAGVFNVAQRAVDLVSLPILALQEALWPRLYADTDHRRRLVTAGAALILMSLVGAVVIVAASFLIPPILGEEFEPAARLMIWLAGLPLLAVLRNLGNFHLIATGRTHLLTWVYLIGGCAGVAFATLLIPAYSLQGAVWASYATEATSLACICVLIYRKD